MVLITVRYPSSCSREIGRCFRSGIGMTYDEHGSSCAVVWRKWAYTKKHRLVQEILPLVPGLVERLSKGLKWLMSGGGAPTVMAQAFPLPPLWDMTLPSMLCLRKKYRRDGVQNVTANRAALAERFDFGFCDHFRRGAHTLPRPLIQHIRALVTAGQWLCEDIKGLNSSRKRGASDGSHVIGGFRLRCRARASQLQTVQVGHSGFYRGVG